MSEPLPIPPPTIQGPPLMARLDPPAEVQAAIGAALRACHAWQPVAVPPRPSADAGRPTALPGLPTTVEAPICDTIDDWPHRVENGVYLLLGAGVVLGLLAAAVLLLMRRLLRAFGRPASLGALVGASLGGVAGAGLWQVGLRSATATEALCLLGGIGGAYGMVRLGRQEHRHGILRGLR